MSTWGRSINNNRVGLGEFFTANSGPKMGQKGEVIQRHDWGGYTLRFIDGMEITYAVSNVTAVRDDQATPAP